MAKATLKMRRCEFCEKRFRETKTGVLRLHRVKGGAVCEGSHR